MFEFFAFVVLLTVIGGLPRIYRGPTRADSMLAAQLSGTGSVAVLLLFSGARSAPALIDIALIFAVLAAVTTISFVHLGWSR